MNFDLHRNYHKYFMYFNKWLNLQENNLHNLFASTIQAFPLTTKRQHSTDTVKITELNWVPFLGVNTLFVKGLAQNGQNEYNPMILFKNVSYHPLKDNLNWVEIVASDGRNYIFEKLNDENSTSVRCNCEDFKWRGNYANFLDKSLFGVKRKKYESQGGPSVNPTNSPMLCKHLIKLVKVLENSGIY